MQASRGICLNVGLATWNVQVRSANEMSAGATDNNPELNRLAMIDLVAHDPAADETVLVMEEPTRWDGSNQQLHVLQERFNAYASFLLDGELADAHPELATKKMRIEVRCAHMPDGRTLELLGMIHDQLEFQDVRVDVI